ncbi:MAG: filamentous hemagglutinin N-terminal domain-containing protein, partial [Phormidesmis sp.]
MSVPYRASIVLSLRALSPAFVWLLLSLLFQSTTFGQSLIRPDNTLPLGEESVVSENFQNLPIEAISGGAQRGQNIFHSFEVFDVDAGRGAYFNNPSLNIQNIISRVTGNATSRILGTLGTFGSSPVNLFFINPNGVIFGPEAVLDVGGAVVITSANGVELGPQGVFSASPNIQDSLLE